jgi:hypothetical protein
MKRRPWVGCEGSKIQFAYWSLWTNTVAFVCVFAVSPSWLLTYLQRVSVSTDILIREKLQGCSSLN